MSHTPPPARMPRAKRSAQSARRQVQSVRLFALGTLLFALIALPFIARTEAADSTEIRGQRSEVSSPSAVPSYFPKEDAYTRILTKTGTANPFALLAATYFSQGSLDPGVLSNWNTSPGGGGLTPPNFTTASD